MDTTRTTVRELTDIPDTLRGLVSIDADAVDVFTLTAPDAGHYTPEQWARCAFEQVAGRKGQLMWRLLLRLRLRTNPRNIAGWIVDGRGDGWLRLIASGPSRTGQLVVAVDGEEVSLLTAVRHDRPRAERTWQRLSPKHKTVAPRLLSIAHTRLARGLPNG
ncbi:MAG TPA: hypothetical protein VE172_08340 [Stackebrandtia sp.]|jgi:hypothetical protein|uniref:hypothetical protein n=1 Tax=Stackebrandtia sp. TaxID=2023065 RepID=UPI002D6EE49E|nr:hypothetical protein [Stackebrandtia sp.]HZE38808.1 hypothetical protein [Stackebrandtia sp.]